MGRPAVRKTHASRPVPTVLPFSRWIAHAPSVPGGRAGGATGTRVPCRQPGSWSPSSRRPLRASSESPRGLSGPHGPGVALRHPRRRFLSRGTTLASGACAPSHLEPLGRSPAPHHCWHFTGNGCHRASWISALQHKDVPSRRRSLATLGAGQRPVAGQAIGTDCHTRQGAGISTPHRRCTHGESRRPVIPNQPSVIPEAEPRARLSGTQTQR